MRAVLYFPKGRARTRRAKALEAGAMGLDLRQARGRRRRRSRWPRYSAEGPIAGRRCSVLWIDDPSP